MIASWLFSSAAIQLYRHLPSCGRRTCGHCSAVSTEKESLCFKEIEQLVQLLDGMETGIRPDCITKHMDFSIVCLNRAVALYSHRHRYGTSDVPADENRCVAAGIRHNHIPFFSAGDFNI